MCVCVCVCVCFNLPAALFKTPLVVFQSPFLTIYNAPNVCLLVFKRCTIYSLPSILSSSLQSLHHLKHPHVGRLATKPFTMLTPSLPRLLKFLSVYVWLKSEHLYACEQYIRQSYNKSTFSTVHFDKGPFACLCEERDKKALLISSLAPLLIFFRVTTRQA